MRQLDSDKMLISEYLQVQKLPFQTKISMPVLYPLFGRNYDGFGGSPDFPKEQTCQHFYSRDPMNRILMQGLASGILIRYVGVLSLCR